MSQFVEKGEKTREFSILNNYKEILNFATCYCYDDYSGHILNVYQLLELFKKVEYSSIKMNERNNNESIEE